MSVRDESDRFRPTWMTKRCYRRLTSCPRNAHAQGSAPPSKAGCAGFVETRQTIWLIASRTAE
jgi:hypothetical protein